MFIGERTPLFKRQSICGYGLGDQLPRNWLPDDDAGFTIPVAAMVEPGFSFTGALGEVLNHPWLYKAYPALASRPLSVTATRQDFPDEQQSVSFHGCMFDSEMMVNVEVPPNAPTEDMFVGKNLLSVFLHEVQHGIQGIERFMVGTTQAEQLKEIANSLFMRSLGRTAFTVQQPDERSQILAQRSIMRGRSIGIVAGLIAPGEEKLKPCRDVAQMSRRLNELARRAYLINLGEIEANYTGQQQQQQSWLHLSPRPSRSPSRLPTYGQLVEANLHL